MRPLVNLRLPDGSLRALAHGDLIGRLPGAALSLDDPAISEAHAMVTLRGGDLKLLALRGLFAIDGRPRQEVVLEAGLRIQLSRQVSVVVEDVVLPESVLAVEADGLPLQALAGAVSVTIGPPPTLHARYRDDADGWIWWSADGWRLRSATGEGRLLLAGQDFCVRGCRFRASLMALGRAGEDGTRAAGAIQAPLTIRARFDTVHLLREGAPPVLLTGQSARIVSELAACGAAVAWEVLARGIWGDDDAIELRRRWDIAMVRLRAKLRQAGIRPDLVRATGGGALELLLAEGDVVEDEQ
jgi:hypothetical protein